MSSETENPTLTFHVNDQQTEQPDYGHDTYTVSGAGTASSHTYTAAEVQTAGITGSERFTASYAADGSATLSVDSAWNTIKNVLAESTGAADVTLRNVVNTDVRLGNGGSSRVSIDGAKRGDIVTGDGADSIAITATSNAGSGNDFNLSTGAGADSVTIAGATYTIANLSTGDGADTVRLTGGFAQISVAAGEGDDVIDVASASYDKAVINGGLGDDTVIIGAGRGSIDTLAGGAGSDVIEVRLSAAQYTSAVFQDLMKLRQFVGNPANAGKAVSLSSLGVSVSDFEALRLLVDGQEVAIDNPPTISAVAGGAGAESTSDSATQVTGAILASDSDGDTLTYTVLADTLAHHGALAVAADGTFVFTAQDADWNGTDRFTVRVSDGRGGQVDQVVAITVTPTQDGPVVGNSDTAGAEDTIITGTVAARDPDGDRLRYSFGTDAAGKAITRLDTAHGTAIIDANTGAYRFIPQHDWSGSDSFTVQVSDGTSTVQAPVTVVVAAQSVATNLRFHVNDQQTWTPDYASGNFVLSDASAFGATDSYTADQMRTDGITAGEALSVSFADADNGAIRVTSGWNSIKSVLAESDRNATIRFDNVVNTDVTLGEGGDSHVTIAGAKRGDITTRGGNDSVDIAAQSNDNGWDNTFNIDTGSGNDSVSVGGAVWTDVNAQTGAGNDSVRLDGTFDDIVVNTGDGDDRVLFAASAHDRVSLDGGVGTDTLTMSISAAQYTAAVDADWRAFLAFAADPANQGRTFTFASLGGIKVTNFEAFELVVDGQPQSLNKAPDAIDDKITTIAGAARLIPAAQLLANDRDPEGDALSIVAVGGAVGGSVHLDGDGQVVFTPDSGFTGAASFTYTISDGNGNQDTATVAVKVLSGSNSGPTAVDDILLGGWDDDVLVADPGGSTLIGGGGNDTLIGGSGNDTLIIDHGDVVSGGGGNDTVIIGDNGGTTIDMGGTGVETVIGGGGNDVVTTGPGGGTVHGGGGNDTAVTGGGDDIVSGGDGDDTIVIGGGTDTVTGGSGTDTVVMPGSADDYTYSHGGGGLVISGPSGTVTIGGVEIIDFGNLQVELDEAMWPKGFRVMEDAAVIIPGTLLLANDSDPDGDTLSIVSVQDAANATISLTDKGNIRFQGAPDFNGMATFTYTITDGHGGFSSATVTVKVWPVNDAPVLGGESFSIEEDTPLTIAAAALLANDHDVDGDTLTVTAVGNAVGGTVTLTGGQVTFTPSANFNGPASFTYSVSDGHGATVSKTVAIDVAPVNDAPVTNPDGYITTIGTVLRISGSQLLSNDSDPDGDAITLTAVGGATGGTVSLVGGNVIFTPAANFSGQGGFTYTVTDGHGGEATQTVSVLVGMPGVVTSLTVSEEIRVNTFVSGNQMTPSTAVLAAGGHVVVWQSEGQTGSSSIYGQRYDSVGNKLGTEFWIDMGSSPNYRAQPVVTALSNGGFVVAWTSWDEDGSGPGIYAQRYDASGSAVDHGFRVNATSSSQQQTPAITGLSDGGFLVVWSSQHSGNYDIYGQRYAANGAAVGGEFLINPASSTAHDITPVITSLTGGGFVVAWQSGTTNNSKILLAQRFTAAGQPTGSILSITSTSYPQDPAITGLTDGGFVVTWVDNDGYYQGIYAQRYDASGKTVGLTFLANSSYTTEAQTDPSVTALADGGFLISWTSAVQESIGGTNSSGVYAQRYDINGVAVGGTFHVNDTRAGGQISPSVAARPDGGFVVSWTSENVDNNGTAVVSRVYSASTLPPVIEANGGIVVQNRSLTAQALVSQSHAQGDALVYAGFQQVKQYQFIDDNGGGNSGRFLLNGAEQAAGTVITVNASDLSRLIFAAGSAPGSDTYRVRAFDGVNWSDWKSAAVNTVPQSTSLTVSGETQVNTYVSGDQSAPSTAVLAAGGHVVVWQSSGQDGSGLGLYGQCYDAYGNKRGTEFHVSDGYTPSDQAQPVVTALSDGGFVVAWTSWDEDGSGPGVYAQRYDASGSAVDHGFRVNATSSSQQQTPAITGLSDGGFLVVWSSQHSGNYDIYGQRYAANGAAVGGEFLINPASSTAHDITPVITSLTGGGFVVAWQSGTTNNSKILLAQRFTAAGQPTGSILSITSTSYPQDPAITGLTDGGFVVTWVDNDGYYQGIYAQRYDASGKTVGLTFLANSSYTTEAQTDPSVTALADGGFLISWTSAVQESIGGTNSSGVYAQRYDINGVAVGGTFHVNDTRAGGQISPSVAARPDGGFVVSWTSENVDNNGTAVVSRVYGSNAVVDGVFQGTANADTFQISRNSGVDTLDNRGHGADGDVVAFAAGIAADQLWFQAQGNDLRVSVIGEASSLTLLGWSQSTTNRVAEFRLADGRKLLAAQVENLVNAMAGMAPSAQGQLNLTAEQNDQLAAVIASSWQHS